MNLYLILAGGGEGGAFDLITPDPGLFLWMVIIFALLWFLLGRFAFKPIAKALKDREESIDGALKSAERARAEMEALSSKNEQLLKEAKEERSKILKEANDVKNKIVAEAKEEAKVEASKILEDARKEIATQKNAAVAEIKGEVGKIAVEIAEQVLSKELTNKSDQEQLVNSLLNNVNFSKN